MRQMRAWEGAASLAGIYGMLIETYLNKDIGFR
jgi:hypothetical protein